MVLVGVVEGSYQPGQPLTPAVEHAVEPVIEQILQELDRLGYWHQEKHARQNPDIWWGEVLNLSRFESGNGQFSRTRRDSPLGLSREAKRAAPR